MENISNTSDPDPLCIKQDIYMHVLKLHRYSHEVFEEKQQAFLSEQDFIIKFWGPVIETMFRKSGVLLHWGDTISPHTMKQGCRYRMDLRMMSCATDELEEGIDAGNAEFAKEQLENKYYKDLLKCVLASKIQLNHILRDRCANEISGVELPLAIFSGMTMDVYALSLKSPGLYVLQDVVQTKFPMTFMDLKNNGIENMIKALAAYKKMAMKIHNINEENEQGGGKRKKMKVIPKNQGRRYASPPNHQYASTWTRTLWKPPRMESDSESENDE